MNSDGRPDPDRLLEQISADEAETGRGRLKIFFGASAGVGKTYAMLSEGRRLLAEGRDVVVGIVEHHGRPDTLALLDGLPVLPLREVQHRGVTLSEFDLDAALARRPGLILVDELAHTNAPGSLHPKRWLDVMTLLDNGIDVYSTLNVQHLDSVNDLVAKMTGIWVQETLPDRIFDEADEVALIDIPSEELLQRLAAGKVYVAEGANRRAAENFFKKSNLTALRELALRRTADRVDAEGSELAGTSGPGDAPLQTRILVVVDADLASANLIRHVRRMATGARASWSAVYVEDAASTRLDEQARLRLERHLRLAEKLGGSVTHLVAGSDAALTILDHARKAGYTRIVVAHRPRPAFRFWQTTLATRLMNAAEGLEVLAVLPSPDTRDGRTRDKAVTVGAPTRLVLGHAAALGLVALVTALCLPARDLVPATNFALVYVAVVVIAAALLGTGPSVLASVAGIGAFNFFFTKPYYSFSVHELHYYITFVVMLVTSVVVGSLTARLARHVEIARGNQDEIRLLYSLTRTLSAVRGVEGICNAAIACLGEPIRAAVTIHVRRGSTIETFTSADTEGRLALDPKEESVVRWVLDHGELAGRHTDTLPSAQGLYLPMKVENEMIGVFGIAPRDATRPFTSMELIQFETFADLIAGTLKRAFRTDEAEQSRVATENERLRNVLLASVSHDLRTPLTVMNGSVGNLLKMRKRLPREAVEELTALWQHLSRLQKFVGNLLRMTAITSGNLKLNFQPYLIQEIIGAAIAQVEPQRESRQIQTAMEGRIPFVEMDGALIEQVLVNLIENACAHTASDGIIRIAATTEADILRVTVSDNGSGLPTGEEERIFETFRRGSVERGGLPADRDRSGTGLGLAICKGIVNAHGGMIFARNNSARNTAMDARGASIVFTLPLTRQTPDA